MNTAKWITNDIVKLIKAIPMDVIGPVTVHDNGQGGDCDSTNLVVEALNCEERFFLCGFHTDLAITTPDDCEVEMVELKDGRDSEGGFSGDDEKSAILYARLKKALHSAGFVVVNTLDQYF